MYSKVFLWQRVGEPLSQLSQTSLVFPDSFPNTVFALLITILTFILQLVSLIWRNALMPSIIPFS